MKYPSLIIVLALAVGAFLIPAPDAPEPGPPAGVEDPPVSICAIEEGSGRTTEVVILSTVDGPTRLTLFASGESAGSIGQSTGASGSVTIPVVNVAAVGTVGGLIEMPASSSAAGTIVVGAESMSAESCAAIPTQQSFITSGSTIGGQPFELHLMNPYAGEAIVELVVQSEAGIESNDRFESVVVPARSSTVVDFAELIPGRETLSIAIETVKGRVLGVGRQGIDGESAVWKAVEGSQDWYLPIPKGGGSKRLVIGTPSNVEVEYQIDYYGPEGLEEAYLAGTLSPRGQNSFDLAAITEETAGVRIISTGPVVPILWINSEAGFAITTASAVEATRWFLPGAGALAGGQARAVILSVGIDGAIVSVRSLREQSLVRSIDLPADGVVEIGLEIADGYLIESSGPIVAMWVARRDNAGIAAMGVPILDG